MEKMKSQGARGRLNWKSFMLDKEVILIGILLCGFYVVFEAAFHEALRYPQKDFLNALLYPDEYETWMRLIALGTIMGLIVYVQRVINRIKKSKQQLEESEEKFKAIVNAETGGVLLAEKGTTNFRFCNKALIQMIGYDEEELLTMTTSDIHPQEILKDVLDVFKKMSKGEVDHVKDIPVLRKDGSVFYADINSAQVAFGGKEYIMGIFRDTTEEKKSKLMLKTERDNAQRYLDIAGVILVVIDADKKVSLVNKKGCEVLGYSEQDMIGKNWFENFIPRKTESDIEHIFAEMMSGNAEAEAAEGPILTKNGHERIISWHNVSIKDDDGNIIGTLSSGEDVTDQRRMQDEIARKNKELESFVYTVSHDLKSPLVTFNGFIEYLVMENKGKFNEKSKHIIERLTANVRYMDHLIRDLLEFSRIGRTKIGKKEIKTEGFFAATIEKFAERCQDLGIEIKGRVSCDCRIYGESVQLHQAINNLVENAIKFIGDAKQGKKIELICQKTEKAYTQFCVKDNGIGINPKYHEKIFEIFHRLNPSNIEAEGTGIGLTLVKKIVDEHGGSIWVVSEEGEGAEFWVQLPVKNGVNGEKK